MSMIHPNSPGDLFDRLEIGMALIDTGSRRIIRVNRAATRMADMSEDQLIGQTWDAVTPPDRREELRARVRRLIDGEVTDVQVTSAFTRPSGEVVHLLVTSSLEAAPDGGAPLLVCQFQDITEQAVSHEHLRLLVDHTPVSLHLVDRQGHVLFSAGASVAATARVGWTSVEDAYRAHPEARRLVAAVMTGERVFRVIEAAGRYYDVHMVPVPSAEPGDGARAVAVLATDVTERETALLELSARSEEQATVVELSRLALDVPDSTLLVERAVVKLARHLDETAVVVYELVAGTARPPVLRQSASHGTPPDSLELCEQALRGAGREVTTGATAVRLGTGDARWHAVAVPLGPHDHPSGVLAVYRAQVRPEHRPACTAVRTAGPRGRGAFNDREITFIRSVAGVLGAAAARLQVERDVRHQALHDGLTGLPNRVHLLDGLAAASAAARKRGEHIGVLLIDVDDFKSINDSYGHQAGDEVLRRIAVRLRDAVRPGDTVARLYGDEFAVLCENIGSRDVLSGIAARIVDEVGLPMDVAERTLLVGVSVGAAFSSADLHDVDGLLRAADVAMYAAKRRGRGRYLVFRENLRSRLPESHVGT
ncbi:sensor domain-containing protein [Frankia sp. AgKG'84/4]|uniref:sensor domain-containing protein n=1 Tax=Frankia sp. AgKG'84/4 TaxID=573490 RepID=UPI00202A9018|nr:sensor domain-containing diguanylate cyclase [Frankia sp. AgKG'84/4]MCL9795140.1 diguanylate cyclase [Frankia sp. AgKG'84/4]